MGAITNKTPIFIVH